jgi:hypothetical protein
VLAEALGADFKGKISSVLYLIAIGSAFVNQWIADFLYVFIAAIWVIPDRRIERVVNRRGGAAAR